MAMLDDGLSAAGVADAEPGAGFSLGHRGNPEARMPLMEHIRELRNRVIKVTIAITIGSIIGWYVYPHVWNFLIEPYCKLPRAARSIPGAKPGGSCARELYVTGIFDALFLRLQVAIATGVIMTLPIWLYQLWAFIAPGLFRRERRWAYYFVGAAVPLFLLGATIAYYAMTKGLHFLLDLVPANTTALITINTYLSYAGAMLLIFGVAFEMPLVFVLLNLAGVLTHERFRKWRRTIIFLIFAFAAVFTPSPDPISMLLLAIPCVVLVEVSEVFAWIHDKRKAARLGSLAYPGLSQEDVARYGLDRPLEDESAGTSTGTGPGT
jgi:sec-independent protein translocase protein TatC